jgi:hypothetical protein
MTQTFAASFAPTTTLQGSTPLWRVAVNDDDTAGYYWGATNSVGSVPVTYTNSAWTAVKPITSAAALTPGVNKYPTGQDTWLIYGPIDLSQVINPQLVFEYYLDSAQGDALKWGVSTNGQTFYGNTQSGPVGRWITQTYSFQTNSTSKTIYLAFAFNSQNNPQRGLGAFIRNVRLTAPQLGFVYLPLVSNNYSPPPPPPVFSYTFNPTDTTDLNAWGGNFTGTTSGYGGSCWFGQGLKTDHGNPVNSFMVANTCKFAPTYASPNVDAPTNFELVVEASPWRLYGEDLYGVIFDAGPGTFGRDGSGNPTFNINGSYYRLSLATNVGNNVVTSILLELCISGSCTPLTSGYAGLQPLPYNLVIAQSAYWDEIRVLRIDDNIKVYINGVKVINLNDGTLVGPRKFGVHIYPLEGNFTDNPPTGAQMEMDFDNIRVYSR